MIVGEIVFHSAFVCARVQKKEVFLFDEVKEKKRKKVRIKNNVVYIFCCCFVIHSSSHDSFLKEIPNIYFQNYIVNIKINISKRNNSDIYIHFDKTPIHCEPLAHHYSMAS